MAKRTHKNKKRISRKQKGGGSKKPQNETGTGTLPRRRSNTRRGTQGLRAHIAKIEARAAQSNEPPTGSISEESAYVDMSNATVPPTLEPPLPGSQPLYMAHAPEKPEVIDLKQKIANIKQQLAAVEYYTKNPTKSFLQKEDLIKQQKKLAELLVQYNTELEKLKNPESGVVANSLESGVAQTTSEPALPVRSKRQTRHNATNKSISFAGKEMDNPEQIKKLYSYVIMKIALLETKNATSGLPADQSKELEDLKLKKTELEEQEKQEKQLGIALNEETELDRLIASIDADAAAGAYEPLPAIPLGRKKSAITETLMHPGLYNNVESATSVGKRQPIYGNPESLYGDTESTYGNFQAFRPSNALNNQKL
jgi:hypothetical protein